ncbi:hypothetical protein LOC67_07350 [Stieleria sp. JC731]|uniref:hypothetical protein n=1 Tax=Pirellulaceae TaxID=2691357 RepID=UPI001E6225DB|nr:hypothetical protein [Stieleria sp. JC731]MCC9600372.1 hypothetical protein [Stieleria sp. JC731]
MNLVWGSAMAAIGFFLLFCGTTKSEFVLYKLLVARSRTTWGQGNAVHRFYQVVGLVLVSLGCLWAAGIIWR